MKINTNVFMHDSDKVALQTLKAIPGFTQLLKAFMKVWNERQFRIINMSSRLRLSENQMAKYYNMLPPICEKLGIEVPELYLELDVNIRSHYFAGVLIIFYPSVLYCLHKNNISRYCAIATCEIAHSFIFFEPGRQRLCSKINSKFFCIG